MLIVGLGTTLVLDVARVRTLYLLPQLHSISRIFVASFFIKLVVWGLELTEKRRLLRSKWKYAAPEATSGFINRAMFIWLNSVFSKGFRTLLTVNTLIPLDDEILSASNPTSLVENLGRGRS